jgi:hypothetical protein
MSNIIVVTRGNQIKCNIVVTYHFELTRLEKKFKLTLSNVDAKIKQICLKILLYLSGGTEKFYHNFRN